MRFYSTKNKSKFYSLEEAVLKGLPDDNGLFMPETIPSFSKDFFSQLHHFSFQEIAFETANAFLKEDIPHQVLQNIVNTAINFKAPLTKFDADTYVLELFHGPTLAFKDFGARFMAQLMSYLIRNKHTKLTILVATSGDTGSAVANGFYKTEGIEVIILYPSNKVSLLQEKQLTTLGENITALEINGTFDDCQRLVKTAFLDSELSDRYQLASANSINIARLIPQSFYYIEAYKQVQRQHSTIVFSVPSGNFGNITAGLIAKRMGLPVNHFIAATNTNSVFTKYIASGKYEPQPSIQTMSNAMDVGNPSNFARLQDLYDSSLEAIRSDISSYSFSDVETASAMKSILTANNYIMDPHGVVGYLGLKKYQEQHPEATGIILETAHPAKFIDVVEKNIGTAVPVPSELKSLADKEKKAIALSDQYSDFKSFLMSR